MKPWSDGTHGSRPTRHYFVGADACIVPVAPIFKSCVGRRALTPPPTTHRIPCNVSLRTSDRCHWCGNPSPIPSAPLPKGGWHGEAVAGGFFPARTHGKCEAVCPAWYPSTSLRLVPLPLGKGGSGFPMVRWGGSSGRPTPTRHSPIELRRGRRLPTVVPTDSRALSRPPIGALPRNRLASSATGSASAISPTPRWHQLSSFA